MDAARTALARDDLSEWTVRRPRILTPLFPTSLLSPGSLDVERRVIGPEQDVPWPAGAAWLEYEPKVAAVLALETSADDEVDPQVMFVEVRVDGEELAKGNLNGTATSLHRAIAEASRFSPLGRGDAMALNPFRQPPAELWPGAEVVVAAEGIGTLRNRLTSSII
jgi:2-keto-4-pentenoate hydratase/2-oxohepta-3-ene-1,7-dioic acid hydratase in catechol pathway